MCGGDNKNKSGEWFNNSGEKQRRWQWRWRELDSWKEDSGDKSIDTDFVNSLDMEGSGNRVTLKFLAWAIGLLV